MKLLLEEYNMETFENDLEEIMCLSEKMKNTFIELQHFASTFLIDIESLNNFLVLASFFKIS